MRAVLLASIGNPPTAPAAPPAATTYLRPGGASGYRRPGGTALYLRP